MNKITNSLCRFGIFALSFAASTIGFLAICGIGGLVLPGSVKRDPNSLRVEFDLTDNLETVKVHFQGILPDLFREGQGIVARGALRGDGIVQAEEVLAKHDENYMPPEVAESLQQAGMPHGSKTQ